jgi:acyl-CoA thioesterase FadM
MPSYTGCAPGERGDGGREFPVLEVAVRYRKALHFDDEVDVSLVIGAVTATTFQVAYLLSADGEARATAVTVHGCVDPRGRPTRLPSWVRELFGPEQIECRNGSIRRKGLTCCVCVCCP